MEEVLFVWEYTQSRYSKIVHSLLAWLMFSAYAIFALFERRFGLRISLGIILFIFLLFRNFWKNTSKRYKLTIDGIYYMETTDKLWKKLCFWSDITGYERSGAIIKLRGKKFSYTTLSLYFNEDTKEIFSALTIINEKLTPTGFPIK